MTNKSVPFLILLVLLISACSSSVTILETPSAASSATTPAAALASKTSTQSNLWKTVRDPRYGFGLAVPCWWLVSPIPADGLGGVMTIKNYDEAYFNTHSTKGFWNWPNGTLKLDVVVMEGVDPSKSAADAYQALMDTASEKIIAVQSQATGSHTATELTIANLNNTADQNTRIFVYRLTPDKIIVINPTPQNIIDTPEFQAMLSSLAMTPDEQVTLPTIVPAPALINTTCTQ